MKRKIQFLALVLLGIMLSINQVWGESPYVGTFPSSGSVSSNSYTLNGVTWGIATTNGSGSPSITFGNAYSSTCIKFGSGASNCYGSVTLSTDYFKDNNYTITGVTVNAIGSAAKNVTMTIGPSSTTKSVANNSWTDLSLSELNVQGTLSISFALNSAGFFIHSITITYEESGSTYTDYLTECAEPTQCATPTFAPAAGTHTGAQNVTISCSTPGATIHYTTNGTTPTSSSASYSSAINVNQDMTLKAIAVKNDLTDSEVATAAYVINYTVTFNMKGHGSAPATLTTVKYNTSINSSKPADPSVAGYTFDGWYKEDALSNAWNWSTDKVTSNTTLYAKWTPITYTITYYNLNGASNSNPTSYTKETATINFADPGARDGYRFDGWYDNSGFTGSAVTTLTKGSTTGDKQYWAKWTERYTITWNNYGDESVKTYVYAGEAIGSLPADPSGDCVNGGKHYDDFKCWYKEEITDPISTLTDSKKVTSATIPTGDVTYYAVYTDLTDPGNVFTRITSPSAIVDGMDIVIAHSSGALQLNSGLKLATLPAESNNQITVTDAKMIWKVGTSGSYFTLTNGTNKLGAASIPGSGSSANAEAAASPTKYQWSFAAHNTTNTLLLKMENTDAALEYYNSAWKVYNKSTVSSTADCSMRVYGRRFVDGKYLTSCCPQISITYDNSIAHGRVSGSKAQACQGETVNLTATPENAAYRFDSWNVYKTGTPATKVTVTDNQFTMPAYPVTVSATFVEAAHYDVTWSVGGDETVVPFVENADLVLPTPPTCPNKSFMGWTTQKNYSNPSSAPGDIFTSAGTKKVTEDITYYAVFATSNVAPDKNFTLDFTTGTNNFGNLANAEGTKTWSYELESGANITASVSNSIWYFYNDKVSTKYYSLRAKDFSTVSGYNGYIRFPGISGYKLTRVVATGATQNSSEVSFVIRTTSAPITTVGAAKTGTTSDMTWDLVGTTAGTAYDMYMVGTTDRSRNMELSSLQLRYVSTGGASYSNYTTECDTKFNINKVENGGTVTVGDSKTKENAGETVTFTVAAGSGYTFGGTTSDVRVYKNYGEDPADIIPVALNTGTFSFTMPDADVTIEPNFVCTKFTVTTNLVKHATLGGIGTYIQVVNNTASSATCGATLGEYSFGIQFKNDTYRSLYHINVSATRGGSPWASGPSSWSFENEIFTMKEGTLTGNVVVSVTLTEDEYTVTTKTAPTTGLATITLYKLDGSAWGSTIPAGQTVYMDAVPGSGYVFDPHDNWKVGKESNESQDAAEVRGPASAGANDGRYYFTMPKENVVVIATIANTAQDTYIDEMHDNVIDPTTTRNNYTVPLLSDDSGGTVDCEHEHLYFVGWSKTSTGVGASSAPGDIIAGGISKTADGSTYYAVWATAVL